MKSIPIKELRATDYPDQKSWIGRLCYDINDSLRAIVLALAGNLTLSENTPCVVRDVQVTGGTYGQSLLWGKSGAPNTVIVGQVQLDPPGIAPNTSAVWADWLFDGTNVQVRNTSGLTTGTSYTVRFLLMRA